MNLPITQAVKSGIRVLLICWWAGVLFGQSRPVDPGLTAHEWGTFTSIAGSDGQAVEWTPLSLGDLKFGDKDGQYQSKELPSFVETLHWGVFKQSLPATIRMETPVLYFYSSHQVTLSVQVKFAKGIITEWYPHAVVPPAKGGLDDAALYRKRAADGAIFWNAVSVQPGLAADFPRDSADNDNRYYAARETSSAPLRVPGPGGDQQEKFLFYRGVSLSAVPISARFTAEGNLLVINSFEQGIPNIIWFERRGDRVGYRISEGLQNEAVMEPPELTATVEHLYGDLEEMLTARGLYREEAHAMVQTWSNSWFEEGSRLFYIVPASFVDSILPLTISPAPAQTVRIFVGRLELISPATRKAVAAALAANDNATLQKYGRFLAPILETIQGKSVPLEKSVQKSAIAPCPVYAAPATAKR
ncbi:MAG TPA: hypothetical protein VI488_00680 [Candidatus Angelobacter sp.]